MASTNSSKRKAKFNKPYRGNDKTDPRPADKDRKRSFGSIIYIIVILFLAVTISIGHRSYLSTLHENDKHFSHLSTLERELSFRTEMGLYFSYFKTMIDTDSTWNALHHLIRDNITEYPSTINTLKRFNLYPEVTLGLAYKVYQHVSDYFDHPTKMCWRVNRGEGLSPVQSCEGLGEPSYFYTEVIFVLNGLMMGLFFLFGTYLSGSIMGGIITTAAYMFNHGECTRVMWATPLRESFGYPFFVLQMFIVTIVIRQKASSLLYSLAISATQTIFMLSWQFAQFALLTQCLAIFGVYVLQLIPKSTFVTIITGHSIGLVVSYIMMFGNEMLLSSFFAGCLVAVWIVSSLETIFRSLGHRLIVMFTQVLSFIVLLVASKVLLSKLFQLEDDAHIAEIFKSKFSDFQNFHTMLYTCAKEFDFIETQTLWNLVQTLLIPTSLFVALVIMVRLLKSEMSKWFSDASKANNQDASKADNQDDSKTSPDGFAVTDGELAYHILQVLACVAMALLVMRLKLFGTPQLCLISSLVASRRLFSSVKPEIQYAAVAALLAGMAVSGSGNIRHELSIMGEFSNIEQEQLVEWIKEKTPKDAVFAGAMPTMATVKLCTLRPIVNHPHYEDAGLRERTKKVYTTYSRKPLKEVRSNLESLGVQYLVLEDSWCTRRHRPGCSMPEIWDIEDLENKGKQPACTKLQRNPPPLFTLVFENSVYRVLKL